MRVQLGIALVASLTLMAARPAHAEGFAGEGPTRMNSTELVVGGGVLTTLGVVSLGGATYVFVADSRGDLHGLTSLVIGVPLLLGGLALVGGGVSMILIGSKRVSDEGSRVALSFVPEPGGAALRLTF